MWVGKVTTSWYNPSAAILIFSSIILFYIGWCCHISLVIPLWVWDLCQRYLKLANCLQHKICVSYTRLDLFIYNTVLHPLMLSYVFGDPLMGLRFLPTIFKGVKLDLCKDISLNGGSSVLWFRAKYYTQNTTICYVFLFVEDVSRWVGQDLVALEAWS
jgi:hypothetical protein